MEESKDMKKFKWVELVNNSDGKTSGSGFAGLIIVLSGVLGFILLMVGYLLNLNFTPEIATSLMVYIGMGSALLGVRKLKK